ncbi:MAG: hypothetical protein AABY16_00670 [Nanoarchaeota archaeon]
MTATTSHDYVFEIAQEIRENDLKEWSERQKESYWRETARICETKGIERDLIQLVSSQHFKQTIGNSHIFTHALKIPFHEADKHYGTMRAGAAHIIRKRNPSAFSEISAKAEAI